MRKSNSKYKISDNLYRCECGLDDLFCARSSTDFRAVGFYPSGCGFESRRAYEG